MILTLPVALILILNAIFLGSETDPQWTKAILNFIVGTALLALWISTQDRAPWDQDPD